MAAPPSSPSACVVVPDSSTSPSGQVKSVLTELKRQSSTTSSSSERRTTPGARVTQSLEHSDNWEDFRGYMQVKRRKLQDQFQDLGQKQSSIFEGVTIYVNGWTQPDADELKQLIHAHGGNYEYNMYPGSRITHVIATNLPHAKVKNLGDTVVCTPQWIVDSIAADRRLPVEKYRLYGPTSGGQKQLGFQKAQPKALPKQETASTCAPVHQKLTLIEGPEETSGPTYSGTSTNILTRDAPVSLSAAAPQQPGCSSTPAAKSHFSSKGADFVSEFYTHSRLHYLSTWSTELKQFTSEMLPRVKPKYPTLPPAISLKATNLRAVVHIDLDCFFVSVSIRDKPHLRGKPVAVAHAKLPKGKGLHSTQRSAAESATSNLKADAEADEKSKNISLPPETSFLSALPSMSLKMDESDLGDASAPEVVQHPKYLLESSSDVASCSYEARKAGVRNGMSVGEALKLCPNLTIVPYEFDNYRHVSQALYETLLSYSSTIEAVSCDEAYIELTNYVQSIEEAEKIVKGLRDEVEAKTGCTVSAGIANNMLLARMATRVAKPNGQFYLLPENMEEFLSFQQVRDLPGVGYSISSKLGEMGVEDCKQLRAIPLTKLQSEFGAKTGLMLYEYSRGIDKRELKLTSERKSLSADINYGIRFSDMSEAESLLANLAVEVEKRAEEAHILGGTITLKLKIRRSDAPMQTRKYLGHGRCDNVSRSVTLLQPTGSATEIVRYATNLLRQIRPAVVDIRGMGIQLTKLVPSDPASRGARVKSAGVDLRKILVAGGGSATTSTSRLAQSTTVSVANPPLPHLATQTVDGSLYTVQDAHTQHIAPNPEAVGGATALTTPTSSAIDESFVVDLPPASQLDSSVLEALPPALRDKILKAYAKDVSQKIKTEDAIDPEISALTLPAGGISATSKLVVLPPEVNPCHRHSVKEGFVVEDQSTFLPECRQYIREWVINFGDGPEEHDVDKVSKFLIQLSKSNLEVVLAVLKSFRRLVVNLEIGKINWSSAFNSILQKLQTAMQVQYGGTLGIEDISV